MHTEYKVFLGKLPNLSPDPTHLRPEKGCGVSTCIEPWVEHFMRLGNKLNSQTLSWERVEEY